MRDYSSIEKGKNLFFIFIGIVIIEQIIFTVEQGFNLGGWLFSALVLFVIFEGHNWAKVAYSVYVLTFIVVGGFNLAAFISNNGLPEVYKNGELIYQGNYTNEILLVSFLIATAITKVSMLLFSKNVNDFLDYQKTQPNSPSYNLQLLSKQLPEKDEFSKKLQAQHDGIFPNYNIATLLPIPNSDEIIVMLSYVNSFNNVIRCKTDGSIVWQADLPNATDDVYTNIEWKENQLMAFSRSCTSVILDVESGKILSPQNAT